MEEENKQEIQSKVKEEIEKQIKTVMDNGLQPNELDKLYMLVDIHKDLENEEYWKTKKEEIEMRYNDYSGYNGYSGYSDYNGYGNESYGRRGVPGSGRGRYREGSYGRRGVDSKYKGEESLNGMYESYREYSDGKNMYGNDNQTMESYEYMLKSLKDFYKHLTKEASSQEEVEMLKDTIQEMAQM